MFELRAAGWENLPSPSCWWIYWCGLTIKIVLHTLVLLHNLSDILNLKPTITQGFLGFVAIHLSKQHFSRCYAQYFN